jgi:hypothetical protein
VDVSDDGGKRERLQFPMTRNFAKKRKHALNDAYKHFNNNFLASNNTAVAIAKPHSSMAAQPVAHMQTHNDHEP